MKRAHLGIVATVIVLSGLAAAYLYLGQHGGAAPAATAAEPDAKEGDRKEEKTPVSRVAQTVQTWPSDKPPVTAQAEPAPASGAVAEAAPAGESEVAQAPPVQPGPAASAAPAADAAPANAAAQAPDQRDAARAEAPPAEQDSADVRTAQTALLASGGEHPGKAAPADAPVANEGAATEPQAAPGADQAVPAVPEAAPSKDSANPEPARSHAPKARAAGTAIAGKTPVRAEERPFDATTAWWPAVSSSGGALSLAYAGEAAFDQAIVLLFSKSVSADAGNQIRLRDGMGRLVSGSWSVSPKNPQMLICKVPPGRYLVSIPAGFADASGDKLGSSAQGPVYVH